MKLNRTGSNWNELERSKINENWDIIEGGYNDIVGQITDEVVGHLIDSAKLIWKEPVDTVEDLPASAEVGETRMVREADPDGISYVYRYDGENWEKIQAIDVTLVNEVDRRLTSQLAETKLVTMNYLNDIGVNVKMNGAVGDYVADDTQAIKDATSFLENGGELFFPRGIYRVTENVTAIFNGDIKFKGDNAIIILDLKDKSKNIQSVIHIQDVKHNVTFEGIEVDANRQASNPLSIWNSSDDTVNVGDVLLENSKFRNGLQTDDTFYLSGVYLRGAFGKVVSKNTLYENMDSHRIESPVSRGLYVGPDSNIDNSAKELIVDKSTFKDIYNYSDVDSDGLSYSVRFDPFNKRDEKLTVFNSTFINCKGRSIKSQVQDNNIYNNKFYRNKYEGRVEVDCQYAGAIINNNSFYYNNYGVQSVVGGAIRSDIHRDFLISGNRFTVDNAEISRIVSISANEGFEMNEVDILNNRVYGKVEHFAMFRISDLPNNWVYMVGNIAETNQAFINVWRSETGVTPILKGTYKDNKELGESKLITTQLAEFIPDRFENNTRIEYSLGFVDTDDDLMPQTKRRDFYVEHVFSGRHSVNKELEIPITWGSRRSVLKVIAAISSTSRGSANSYTSILECYVVVNSSGVVKLLEKETSHDTLGSWDVESTETGIIIKKSAGTIASTYPYFVKVFGNDEQ